MELSTPQRVEFISLKDLAPMAQLFFGDDDTGTYFIFAGLYWKLDDFDTRQRIEGWDAGFSKNSYENAVIKDIDVDGCTVAYVYG